MLIKIFLSFSCEKLNTSEVHPVQLKPWQVQYYYNDQSKSGNYNTWNNTIILRTRRELLGYDATTRDNCTHWEWWSDRDKVVDIRTGGGRRRMDKDKGKRKGGRLIVENWDIMYVQVKETALSLGWSHVDMTWAVRGIEHWWHNRAFLVDSAHTIYHSPAGKKRSASFQKAFLIINYFKNSTFVRQRVTQFSSWNGDFFQLQQNTLMAF